MKRMYVQGVEDENGNIICQEVEVVEYDVYFLMKDNKVIYIGCTSNIKNRISQHKSIRDFDSYFIYRTSQNKFDALKIERSCINLLSTFSDCPLQNKSAMKSIFNYREIIKVK